MCVCILIVGVVFVFCRYEARENANVRMKARDVQFYSTETREPRKDNRRNPRRVP